MPATVEYMGRRRRGKLHQRNRKEGGLGLVRHQPPRRSTGSSSYVEAKVAVKNPTEDLISGFNANIKINTRNAENTVIIPVDTLKLIDGEKYVFVYNKDDNRIYQRKVELGLSEETKYQVVSGLKAGEQIVRTFSSRTVKSLKDGMKVKVSEKIEN